MSDLAEQRYLVPAPTKAAIAAAVRAALGAFKAVPPMHLSEWAAQHFKMAGESSHQRGGWEAWPFQVGIMNLMSDDDIVEVDVMKSKRVGYTKILTASIAFDAAHRRLNQALWQPTDDDRDSYVKSELDPILEAVPAVREARSRSKQTEDTMKFKRFIGCVMHLLGGKAARAYRRITVARAKLDEIDGFDQRIEKSSDPFTLAYGRLEGAANPKIILGTTPRVRGMSHIERRVEQADVLLRYNITCRHCGAEHPLIWGGKKLAHGFKWEPGQPETVRHICPHCRGSITQADYLARWQGRWICERTGITFDGFKAWHDAAGNPVPKPRHVAVHVWSAYSPQREWADIARECIGCARALEAGDDGPMQGFRNETLGETWELSGERTEEHALQARAESYLLGTVPVGALVLTAGIDVQNDRWEIEVWGWGPGLESWIVDSHVIEGNPADEREWEALAVYLRRRYPQVWKGASTLGIDAISIDSGHHTQAVYHFVRQQQAAGLRIHAIKGSSEEGKPIRGAASVVDVNWKGKKWPRGLKLWMLGTDTVKDLLLGQLAIERPGPGYVHFSASLPREWYEQLTAEQRVPMRTATGTVLRWVKRRPRNEKLDGRVYATHSAFMLGLDRFTDARWRQVEAVVQPPPDLFGSVAPPAAAPAEAVPRPPLQSGRISTANMGRRFAGAAR